MGDVLQLIGVSMINHYDVKSHLMYNIIPFLNATSNRIWGGILIAIIREIWKHRNDDIFKNDRVNHVEVFTFVQMKVWSWMMQRNM